MPKPKYWYYCPFPEFDEAIQQTKDAYKSKFGDNVIEASEIAPLSGVAADDVLFIDGHGEIGMDNGDSQNREKQVDKKKDLGLFSGVDKESEEPEHWLTPNSLAGLIREKGLPNNHKTIRLLSCYGGGLRPD